MSVSTASQAALTGPAVADVIHLLAELIENATTLSPPYTPVRVSGDLVASGFAVEIEDRGLGMSEQRYVELNDRLAEPPEFDLFNSEQLGLFVVGQLAKRHGIRVTLRPSPYGGTTAIALIPATLVGVEEGFAEGLPTGMTAISSAWAACGTSARQRHDGAAVLLARGAHRPVVERAAAGQRLVRPGEEGRAGGRGRGFGLVLHGGPVVRRLPPTPTSPHPAFRAAAFRAAAFRAAAFRRMAAPAAVRPTVPACRMVSSRTVSSRTVSSRTVSSRTVSSRTGRSRTVSSRTAPIPTPARRTAGRPRRAARPSGGRGHQPRPDGNGPAVAVRPPPAER